MNRFSPWGVGGGICLVLMFACAWSYSPPPIGPQRFTIAFKPGQAGEADPLVVTGRTDEADFLAVEYRDTRTIAFKYDSWGSGGPVSRPITITPGQRYSLEVELPSLAATATNAGAPPESIRVIFDGRLVLSGPVAYYYRPAGYAWFGENPVGGAVCGPRFRGILRPEATPPAGPVGRLVHWLRWGRWQLAGILLLSIAVAWTGQCAARLSPTPLRHAGAKIRAGLRFHRPFLLTTFLCAIAFTAMMTSGTFRLVAPEVFGRFYDHQAVSLLHGRLDVPAGSLSGEAFLIEGKAYGYFGPTPALFRLPGIIFGLFFGDVSRAAMLVYYLALLAGSYAVLRDAVRLLRPERPEPAPGETILFTLHVGLGSTAFFLGSRTFAYHEAILCGLTCAVWSGWCSLRHVVRPASRWWVGGLALGVLSIQARATTGLFALLLLAACVLYQAWPDLRARRFGLLRRPLLIAVLAGLGVGSFSVLSYIKFGTIEGCPLRLNSQYDSARLARIDSRQFHLSNIPYGLATYFLHPRAVVRPEFPWLYMPETLPTGQYPGAKLDISDYTLALPVGMTGLFLLATAGSLWAAWRRPPARHPVAALWLSFVVSGTALCAAVATAERYTGDFVPFLVCGGAYGLAALNWRRPVQILFVLTTLWASAITVAATLNYQGRIIWGVPPEVTARYERLCERVDRFFGIAP